MAAAPKRSNFLQFLLLFALVYFGTQMLLRILFPAQFGPDADKTGLILRPADATLAIGHHPILILENRTESPLTLSNRCPEPPVDLFDVRDPGTTRERLEPITSPVITTGCEGVRTIEPGSQAEISFAPWKYSLFERIGTFEARIPAALTGEQNVGTGSSVAPATVAARFTIEEPGVFTKLFRTFVTAPLLNVLIFIASIIPSHSLGLSIILITLLVKLLLFFPTKHALEGQKKMQLLQPKLEALKHQYPNDPQKQQQETLRLWKEHKINPFSSCLPTLLQLPILIGLFYVIRDGSHLELSRHLIYSFYQDLPWSFDTFFLGLDLLRPSIYIMPPLLVAMQFIQMKLAFKITANKKAKSQQKFIDVPAPGEKAKKEPASAQDIQQRVMLYGLPLLIGFFAFQFPAAVSIYWGISTLFSIGQQVLVNREHLRV